MAEDKDDLEEVAPPQAKRTGRDSAEPRSQPGEFADDMVTNRFGPPPDVGEEEGD
jgi:hypothetical protein